MPNREGAPLGDLSEKLVHLSAIVRQCGSLIVAYSGGVDSAVVMAVALRELGARTLACIANSPSYPASELEQAVQLARTIGCPCRIIQTNEHTDPNYLSNSPDRCFHCKTHLFSHLAELAQIEGYAAVADGVHCDDLHDHAGGIRAARQFSVRSPLLEAALGKRDVRDLAQFLGLPVSSKPSSPCLASRVPHGTTITMEILKKIDQAETCLRDLGFSDVRVRHHGDTARIELPDAQFSALLLHHQFLVRSFTAIGYAHVTLDLNARGGKSLAVIGSATNAQSMEYTRLET